jgi:hypothetical protein
MMSNTASVEIRVQQAYQQQDRETGPFALAINMPRTCLLCAVAAALVLVLLHNADHAVALRILSSGQQQQGPHPPQQHAAPSGKPQPPVWPEQFKAVMLQNRTDNLALVTLFYDWKLKANLNIIASQLGARGTIWDLEWNNVSTSSFILQPTCCGPVYLVHTS